MCTPATYLINYTFCESVWVNCDRVHPHWLILPAKFTLSSLLTSFPRDIFVPRNNTLGMVLKRQECDGILMVLITFYKFCCLWKLWKKVIVKTQKDTLRTFETCLAFLINVYWFTKRGFVGTYRVEQSNRWALNEY